MARRVAEILLLRIAGRDIGRQVGKICDELLANIAEPHPVLMADVALNSSDASAFHQNLKNKMAPIDAVLWELRHTRLGSDRRGYVVSCVALHRRMGAQTGR